MSRSKNSGHKGAPSQKGGQLQAKPAKLEIPALMPMPMAHTVDISLADAIAELKTIQEEEWEEILPMCCLLLKERIASLCPAGNAAAPPAPCGSSASTSNSLHANGMDDSAQPRGPITPTYSASENVSPSVEAQASSASEAHDAPTTAPPTSDDAASSSSASHIDCVSSGPNDHDWSAAAAFKASHQAFEGDHCNTDDGLDVKPSGQTFAKECLKIFIPVHEYPGFNFIGRLLGPRGVTLKNLQNKSGCRLYIRGRGSLRFKDVHQEQLKATLPGYEHLREALHVLIEYEGALETKESSLRAAELMVNDLLVPPVSDDQDELKKTQLKELAILNGTYQENKTLNSFAGKSRGEQQQQHQHQLLQMGEGHLLAHANPFQAHATYMATNGLANAHNGTAATGRGMMMHNGVQPVYGRGTGTLFQPAPIQTSMGRNNMLHQQQMHLQQRQIQMQGKRYSNNHVYDSNSSDYLTHHHQQQQQQHALLCNNIASQFYRGGKQSDGYYDNNGGYDMMLTNQGGSSLTAAGFSRSSSASSNSSFQPKSAPYVPLWVGDGASSGYTDEFDNSHQYEQQQQKPVIMPVAVPASTLWVPPPEAQQQQQQCGDEEYSQFKEEVQQVPEQNNEQWVDDDFVAALGRASINNGTPSARRKSFGTPTQKPGHNETYSPCMFGSIETPPGAGTKGSRVALGEVSANAQQCTNMYQKVSPNGGSKLRWHPYQRSPRKAGNQFSFDAAAYQDGMGVGGGYRLF